MRTRLRKPNSPRFRSEPAPEAIAPGSRSSLISRRESFMTGKFSHRSHLPSAIRHGTDERAAHNVTEGAFDRTAEPSTEEMVNARTDEEPRNRYSRGHGAHQGLAGGDA